MLRPPPRLHPLRDITGPGPLVVFVHGLEDDCRSWVRLARCLPADWRPVALGMPWHAGNDYRWRFHGSPADWLATGLAALPEPPVLVVGHSFGANALLELLATGPDPLAPAAVLAAPFYRPPDEPPTWRTFDRSRRAFERQLGEGVRVRLDGRRCPPESDVVERVVAGAWDRIGPNAFLAVFEQYVASGHLPLAAIDTPLLVIAGAGDPGLSDDHLGALVARLPGCTLVADAHYDHFCHVRQATQVADAIERFAAEALAPDEPRAGSVIR